MKVGRIEQLTHTPGPWNIASPDRAHVVMDADHRVVVVVRSVSRNELLADTRLISAAPDLLAALKAIQSQYAGHSDEFSQRVWNIADAVIKKAEAKD